MNSDQPKSVEFSVQWMLKKKKTSCPRSDFEKIERAYEVTSLFCPLLFALL
jgi:hypothetical protein